MAVSDPDLPFKQAIAKILWRGRIVQIGAFMWELERLGYQFEQVEHVLLSLVSQGKIKEWNPGREGSDRTRMFERN